jgi:2-oxoglutarate ferredoxin oxidoreductase subunit delta
MTPTPSSTTDQAIGDTVDFVVGSARLTVRRAYCKGCKLCLDACPAAILVLDEEDLVTVTDINQCTFCGLCAARCPDFVFVLTPHSSTGLGQEGPG